MTLSDLQTLVLSWLDDPNAGYFTLPQVNVWLNNAQQTCQKQLLQAGENYYVTKVESVTTQYRDSYALPSDFLKCHKLEIVLSNYGTVNEQRRTLAPTTLVQIDRITETGTPEIYTLKKNCMIMRHIPDRAYPMYMHYSYLVADMVNQADVPDAPPQYHEYLAVLATLDGLLKDQRDPAAMMSKRDFYLAMMKADAEQRTVDAPRHIIMTEEEDFGGEIF